ncbi:DUF423 domain-containing protein [Sediminibacterium sp.]|uniref:DUF423 domain-containing protein n=1 Tax=Sediminibacterium sp. TaxID=1917865 RepID=UPI003F6ED33F
MHKGFVVTASLLGALAVLLGAFGAHGLKNYASPTALNTYETAVKYQFYHVFALALSGILYGFIPASGILTAGKLFIAGMAVFSGSLYLLTFFSIAELNQFKWVGAITPIGGLLLVAGWVVLGFAVLRFKG